MSLDGGTGSGPEALVILLRRDPEDLTDQERFSIESKFSGCKITYRRTDPRDYKEHAAQCEELRPAAVILPLERPIPSLAMEKGIPHVAFVQGQYQTLLPIKPQFEEFNPDT